MPEIAVNRIEYTVGDDGPIIWAFGRDAEGNAKRVEITGMHPYFYSTNKSLRGTLPATARIDRTTQFRSIVGEPCTRIYTTNPGEVRDLRERFDHLEADVVFTVRFQIDTGICSGMSYPSEKCTVEEIAPVDLNYPSRVCTVDIECSDENGWPDARNDPITAITCHDSFTKQYVTFVLGNPDTPIPRKKNCTTAIYQNEKDLLKAFIVYINDTDPDILTGWNVNDFDIPYIMGRFEANRLDKDSIARLPGMSLHDDTIRGRQVFDLLAGYKRMHLTKKESYRLDAIAEAEIGEHKVHFSGKICELPLETLVEYNRKDVELCVRIDAKDEIVDFHREIAKYVGCSLDRTLNSMPLIDVYILRKAKEMKFVLPSKGKMKDDGEQFEGATVFAPRKGLHKNCIVLDLTSLYPMVMMTGNMSPDTKDPEGEIMAPTGVRFRKSPDGMVRSIQAEFFASRKEMKRMRGTFDFGSRDYKLYDMKQNVVKVLMNSYYGVSGNSAFRLYDKEIGASVTSVGREILKHNKKLIEEEGLEVIMGDTDSCVAPVDEALGREGTIALARMLEKKLNDSYPGFAKSCLNADVSYFSVKFEKLYERFFSGGRKKRYAGLLVWKEGKDVKEVDVVGYEMKRSDTPLVTKGVQKMLIEKVLNGDTYENIRNEVSLVLRVYRADGYTLDEIGIPGGIGKSLDEYENPDAQVRGCIYANNHFGANFGRGSKPKRIYIKRVPSQYPRTDVICFEYGDQVPEGFDPDKELMIEKTIRGPLERIMEALDWDWIDFDPTTPTLAMWGI